MKLSKLLSVGFVVAMVALSIPAQAHHRSDHRGGPTPSPTPTPLPTPTPEPTPAPTPTPTPSPSPPPTIGSPVGCTMAAVESPPALLPYCSEYGCHVSAWAFSYVGFVARLVRCIAFP